MPVTLGSTMLIGGSGSAPDRGMSVSQDCRLPARQLIALTLDIGGPDMCSIGRPQLRNSLAWPGSSRRSWRGGCFLRSTPLASRRASMARSCPERENRLECRPGRCAACSLVPSLTPRSATNLRTPGPAHQNLVSYPADGLRHPDRCSARGPSTTPPTRRPGAGVRRSPPGRSPAPRSAHRSARRRSGRRASP